MTYTRQNRDVIHALIESQGESLRNTSHTVLSGCEVTVNTGDLGSGNNTLSVASGEVLLGGTAAVSVASQSVSLPAANSSYPRWDLVVVDESTQAVEVRSGDPMKPNRGGERLRARNVFPPDLAAQDATPLALVWIPAGANSIDSTAPSEDIFDVRPMQTVPRVDADATHTGQLHHTYFVEPGESIHSALNSANPGGIVYFRDGTHTLSQTVNLDDVTNVTFTGDDGAVVRAEDNFNGRMFNNVNGNPVTNVRFEGFEIDGNYTNQDHTNNTSYYVIGGLSNSENIELVDMTIHSAPNNAVVISGGDNCRVLESEIYDVGHPNAQNTAAGVAITGGSGHVIAFNEFGRATDNACYTRNNGSVVIGNRFNEVMVYLSDIDSYNQYYLFNEIRGTPKNPVDGSVQGGRFFRFEQDNITEFYIVGNIVHSLDANYGNFVQATGATTGLARLHITDNIVLGGGFLNNGIFFNDTVDSLTVNRNFVAETRHSGIRVNGAVNGTVSENIIYNTNTGGNSFAYGLSVNRPNTTPTENVTVAENKIIDDRATTLHYDGLRVASDAGDWITLADNVVRNATNAERDVDTACSHLVSNGVAYNAGDPSAGNGQWAGEGFEGLRLRDTTNNTNYWYVNGAWEVA